MTAEKARLLSSAVIFAGCLFFGLAAEGQNPPARQPWTTSRVQGSPVAPEPFRLAPAFANLQFQLPTSIEESPSGRLLVTQRDGKIFSFPNQADVRSADLVADLAAGLTGELAAKGVSLFDAELHPKFVENRFLFVCYVHPDGGGQTRLSRLMLTADDAPRVAPGSEKVVLTWPSGGHNAGCLEFGTDGFLYIATGDGTGPNPPDGLTTGQTVTDLLGAILRIDVDRTSGELAYVVPADNPFVEMKGARPEIWAYGLRNPWKFGVDPKTGNIFAADNGWESWEMVHQIVRGGNCGWPVMEGRAALRTEVPIGPTPIRPPVMDHSHTEANSVIGGPVYRGNKLADLDGSFVYGDYITGTIWAIRPNPAGGYGVRTLVDTDQRIVAFTQTSRGQLLVLDYDFTGQIYELLPSDVPDTSATFPRRLSETGLFASTAKLEPAAGVVPYRVKVAPWNDGAAAQRWVAIPGTGQIELSAGEQPASYPEGTVLVKHLSLPQASGDSIRLETQLLHLERGTWRPYSYLWDEAGQDAQLVDPAGASRPLKPAGLAERTWRVNATNECKLCHNAGPRFVLGFVPNQLNMTPLVAAGVFAKAAQPSADDPLRLVDPHDPTQPLEDRARSYLHVNCAMCHHPGGNAIVSFFLRRDLPFEKLNTNKGTGIGTFGMPEAKIIAAGDPYRSVLLYRMAKLGYARMPYIGSQVVDSDGVLLIEKWIRSLPAEAGGSVSTPLAANSQEAGALKLVTADRRTDAMFDTAVQTLLKSTPASLALIARLHGSNLSEQGAQSAIGYGSAVNSADIRGLFDTFLPENKRRVTLGASPDPQKILSLSGDRARGQLIFASDGARCRNCHDASDRGQSIGPTLQEINKKYAKRDELLQHVLQPSLKVEDAFAAHAALTNDGRTVTGLVAEQSDQEVVLKTAEKQLVRLRRAEIAEFRKSPKSLMPDQILSDLTAQQAADLLEYLRSLGSGP